MAEYIERTSELILAANAGARAIENTRRYHGAYYMRDVFAPNSAEIAYLQAAEVLRGIEDAPAADVAPVVRCCDCKYHYDCGTHFCDRLGMDCPDESDFFCKYGARMDGDSDALD